MDIRSMLAGLVGTASQGVQPAHPLAAHYTRYLGALAERALGSWSAVHAAGVRCQLELQGQRGERANCGAPAIGPCMVCSRTVCVSHALVSPDHIMCLACAHAAQHMPTAAEPKPNGAKRPSWEQEAKPFGFVDDEPGAEELFERSRHLDVLGLDLTADAVEIKEAYRRLAKRYHPDRAAEADKQPMAAKLVELNQAYEWLTAKAQRAA